MSEEKKFKFGTAITGKGFAGFCTSTPFEQHTRDQQATSWFASNASQAKTSVFGEAGAFTSFGTTTYSPFGSTNYQNTSYPELSNNAGAKMDCISTTPNCSREQIFSSTAAVFGSNTASTTTVNSGTSMTKYHTTIATDTVLVGSQNKIVNTKIHCVTAMKEYESKSLEELRMEDLNSGRVLRASGFRTCGQNRNDAPANTVIFRAKYQPTIATEQISGESQINVNIHCVTAMQVYEDKSLEELRMEYYLGNRTVHRPRANILLKGLPRTTRPKKKESTPGSVASQSFTGLFGRANAGGNENNGLFVSTRIASGSNSTHPFVGKTFGVASNTVFGSSSDSSNPFTAPPPFGQAGFTWSATNLIRNSASALDQRASGLAQQPSLSVQPSNMAALSFAQTHRKNTTSINDVDKNSDKLENSGLANLVATNSLIFRPSIKQKSPSSAITADPNLFDPAGQLIYRNTTFNDNITREENNEVSHAIDHRDQGDIENTSNRSEHFPNPSSNIEQTVSPLTRKPLIDGSKELDSIIESLTLNPDAKCLTLENSNNNFSGQKNTNLNYLKQEPLQKESLSNEIQSNAFRTHRESYVMEKVTNAEIKHDSLANKTLTEIVPLKPLNVYRNTFASDQLLVSTVPANPSVGQNYILSRGVTAKTSHDSKIVANHSSVETEKLLLIFDNIQPNYENHPTGIKLNKVGYYTIPSMNDLKSFLAEDGSCVVPNFTVGREGYGNVYFDTEMDVAGLNLDEIVHFRNKEVIIYPDDDNKPPVGHGLNREAEVTLNQVWPLDKCNREVIKDYQRLLHIDWEGKLRRICDKNETIFVEYIPETGSLIFRVKHF